MWEYVILLHFKSFDPQLFVAGKILDRNNADVAVDHYHLYEVSIMILNPSVESSFMNRHSSYVVANTTYIMTQGRIISYTW